MRFPFFNLVGSSLLFIQSVLLFLKFRGDCHTGKCSLDAHWSVVFAPLYVALVMIIAILGGTAVDERQKRRKEHPDADEVGISSTVFDVLSISLILLAIVFLSMHLHSNADVPFYWITTTFFSASAVWLVKTGIELKTARLARYDMSIPEDPTKKRNVGVFTAVVFFIQGLFLILMDGPCGKLFKVSLWLIALPTFVFFLMSMYRTIVQTSYKRNGSGFDLARQAAFILLLLLCMFAISGAILHINYPDLMDPQWIALPFLVYSGLLVVFFFFFTCVFNSMTSHYYHGREAVARSKLDQVQVTPASASPWPRHHFMDDHGKEADSRLMEQFDAHPMQW